MLGSILHTPGTLLVVRPIVAVGDFHDRRNAVVYHAMLRLEDLGEPIAVDTVIIELQRARELDKAGGIPHLAELADYVPAPSNEFAQYHARQVRERAALRNLAKLGRELERDPTDEVVRALLADELEDFRGRPKSVDRFQLLADTAILELPPPKFLVGDKLVCGTLAILVGPPGHGKTFLALAWANSVATGLAASGDLVHTGPVVYVAAEGTAGLGARIKAWKTTHKYPGALGVHFVTEPVSLLKASDIHDFLRTMEALPAPPVLIVLDTLARCLIGGDENSTQDMSAFVAGADRIKRATGATVLILHHMNAGGERERGNTALRGASDTLMFVKSHDDILTLTCEKQKDAAPFPKARYRLEKACDSCAVVTATGPLQSLTPQNVEKQVQLLALLHTHFPPSGATATEWLKASTVRQRTFYNYKKSLLTKGYINPPGHGGIGKYTVSRAGERFVTASCNRTATSLHCSTPE